MSIISKLETQRYSSNSLPEEQWAGTISKFEIKNSMTATHFLRSQGQMSSGGLMCGEAGEAWQHSQAEEPKTGISSPETQ